VTDAVAGQIQMVFTGAPALVPMVRAGKLRAIAVSSPKRLDLLPDVPTLAEAGFPGMEASATFGLMLPGKTPPSVTAKIHAAMKKAITNPTTRKQLDEMGYQVVANSPEQFGIYLREQITNWTKIVKDNKIKAE